jgi:hypothetical protein
LSFKVDDYVDVAERIREFYEKYPDGRLCAGSEPRVVLIGDRPFIWYHARAYRTPDDQVPGDGYAAEPVPGPTQFTRDSELMNAETAAWGRAIVALGFATKKIASRQEVEARTGSGPDVAASEHSQRVAASEPQKKRMFALANEKGLSGDELRDLVFGACGKRSSKDLLAADMDAVFAALEAA